MKVLHKHLAHVLNTTVAGMCAEYMTEGQWVMRPQTLLVPPVVLDLTLRLAASRRRGPAAPAVARVGAHPQDELAKRRSMSGMTFPGRVGTDVILWSSTP